MGDFCSTIEDTLCISKLNFVDLLKLTKWQYDSARHLIKTHFPGYDSTDEKTEQDFSLK